ncbi:MAG: bifunctional 5,6,7,8-tetrahydromethanopterin hydro-lyase/3-hexulose-6-phosphate synthase [Candidatus Odinarchaeota archaeon]
MDYLVGEALLGTDAEVAHIDLLVGDKNGPVGAAFANGLTQLSQGHTPLLAVIRPNLPPKPMTLIVPKVTVQNLEQANKIFGPAQAAVAKAIADAVEEGLIPQDKLEDWVIIVSVFIHPAAQDDRKIYHFNYSATKLALKRALTKYPPLEKILYDKDRARHPIMGFKVPRLWRPPYLQIALDVPSIEACKSLITTMPQSDRIILEAGTPLIKRYGVNVIRELREIAKDMFIIADLKTLDVGNVEVDMAFEATADAVVASGLATNETLDKFIYEAQRMGIYAFIDMMNVTDPLERVKQLKEKPDVIILHRSVDAEQYGKAAPKWEALKPIRDYFQSKKQKILLAVAGGIQPSTALDALKTDADILIVGRYITQARDPERAVREFIHIFEQKELWSDVDLFRSHVE